MAGTRCILVLGCALACGCAESTAPVQAGLTGRWDVAFSVSGQVETAWARCSGVLYLTLTQTDTLLTGQIDPRPSLEAMSCRISASGLTLGIPAPYTVAGTVTAAGRIHLVVPFFPDSLVFVSSGPPLAGVATSTFPAPDTSGTMISVPLTGAFQLVRAP